MTDIEENIGAVVRVDNTSSPSTVEPPAIATTSRRSEPPATEPHYWLAEMNQKIGNMANLIGKLLFLARRAGFYKGHRPRSFTEQKEAAKIAESKFGQPRQSLGRSTERSSFGGRAGRAY